MKKFYFAFFESGNPATKHYVFFVSLAMMKTFCLVLAFNKKMCCFCKSWNIFAFFAIPKKSWNIAIFPPPAVLSLIHSWTWEKYQTRPSLHISTLTCTLRQGWKWHDISLLTTQMPLSKMICRVKVSILPNQWCNGYNSVRPFAHS